MACRSTIHAADDTLKQQQSQNMEQTYTAMLDNRSNPEPIPKSYGSISKPGAEGTNDGAADDDNWDFEDFPCVQVVIAAAGKEQIKSKIDASCDASSQKPGVQAHPAILQSDHLRSHPLFDADTSPKHTFKEKCD
jgi:hypothetical protein